MQVKQKRFKLSEEDSLNLFFRIVKMVKSKKKGYFTITKIRGDVHGYCDWEDGIVLDYRKELIATLIHECVHYLEPDWSERNVIDAEKTILRYVPVEEITDLIKIFSKKI